MIGCALVASDVAVVVGDGSLKFLDQINAGQRPELGARVLIIGGGNSAIDSARSALRIGAKPTLVYRRREEDMPAILSEIEELKGEGIGILELAAPVRFIAKNGQLNAVEFVKMELKEVEADGRRRPVPIVGSEFTIPAETFSLKIPLPWHFCRASINVQR